jgi:NADH-quinone oxidoreductase subunit L
MREYSFEWLRFSDRLSIDMGVLLDPLSIMMLVVVGIVASMVVVYSVGYMKGERGYGRYFGLLGLFVFSMLGLVLAGNLFQMYIFWELVGASSYLLIGFYYTRPAAVAASKKAFIVTRFADLGFLIGILVLASSTGTFDFAALTADRAALPVETMTTGRGFLGLSAATWAMGLLFMGGAGKSAMFPLHVWLPDAMEGPTPVSALIHAATMVVAGVFLVARLFPVYVFAAPDVLTLITWTGVFTALFAAVVAVTQTDIKRVLAFSTISQIAYMMVALGVSGWSGAGGEGYTSGIFHLFTHAFFKALLFLGAGAVIHAVHSNEMSAMGGLRRYMPVTHATFLVACLSISGVPPFSGFWSKDGILAAAWHHDRVVFWIMLFVAGLTAFYMFRLYFRVFWGVERRYARKPREAPAVMTVPLVVLAALTCVTGFVPFWRFISPDGAAHHAHPDPWIAAGSVAAGLTGILIAARFWLRASDLPARAAAALGGFRRAASRRFHIDAAWEFLARRVIFGGVSRPVAWFDRHVVDGAVNALGDGTERAAEAIRPIQSGKVQTYAVVFVVAVLAITAGVFLLI